MPHLGPKTIADLRSLTESACTNTKTDLPSATVVVVGREGDKELFAQCSGHDRDQPARARPGAAVQPPAATSLDSVYWLASCTKLITGIACMQLVERGKLRLDDATQVEELCPELRDVKVLQENEEDGSLTLVEKQRRITLRMLLTHMAGFGYSFLNEKLRRYSLSLPVEYDEFSGQMYDFRQPLVNQPGDMFEYGINIDWAGFLVERITGVKLNDYMQQNIFVPLHIKDLSMFPSKSMKERLVGLRQRDTEGTLSYRGHILRRPLTVETADEIAVTVNSGGAGLFGKPQEYCKVLATLLNNGVSPITGKQLLSPATLEEMFQNQIPHLPNFARRHLPAAKPDLVYPAAELYPLAPSAFTPQGFGLTSLISPSVTGRSVTTIHWTGLCNVFWWCDREKGVAGMVASQILPFADSKAVGLWAGVESKVYEGLQAD